MDLGVEKKKFIELGTIVKPHGIHGSVLVRTLSGQESALEYVDRVFVGPSKQQASVYLVHDRAWMPKGWKLSLEGIQSEGEANSFRGFSVYADRKQLHSDDDNGFYIEELVGVDVVDEHSNTTIGKLTSVERAHPFIDKGHDLWCVALSQGGTISIPAIEHFVSSVQLQSRPPMVIVKNLTELSA